MHVVSLLVSRDTWGKKFKDLLLTCTHGTDGLLDWSQSNGAVWWDDLLNCVLVQFWHLHRLFGQLHQRGSHGVRSAHSILDRGTQLVILVTAPTLTR